MEKIVDKILWKVAGAIALVTAREGRFVGREENYIWEKARHYVSLRERLMPFKRAEINTEEWE